MLSADVVYRGKRQLRVTVRDETGQLMLRFLNFYSSQLKQMALGRRFRIFGVVRGGLAGSEMIHPRMRACDKADPLSKSLTPVYPSRKVCRNRGCENESIARYATLTSMTFCLQRCASAINWIN